MIHVLRAFDGEVSVLSDRMALGVLLTATRHVPTWLGWFLVVLGLAIFAEFFGFPLSSALWSGTRRFVIARGSMIPLGRRRRRRGILADAFVPIHVKIPEAVERVQTDEAAVPTDERSNEHHPRIVGSDEFRVAVCLDSRPFAVVSTSGTLTQRAATAKEVLELPRIHRGRA